MKVYHKMIVYVCVCWIFFFEEETSFEKISPSNLYVGKSTGHFLD